MGRDEPLARFQEDQDFEDLVKAMLRQPTPLALIGAGISIASGYPSWAGLLEELQEAATQTGLAGKTSAPLSPRWQYSLTALQDPPWQAEEYLAVLGSTEFKNFISKRFGPPKKVMEPHPIIARLGFRHYLTTNFDPCIEIALRDARRKYKKVEWSERAKLRDFLLQLSRPDSPVHVVYLHGRYQPPSGIALAESAYVRRYVESEDARRKLLAIFITQPVVFMGFSVNDPDLAHFMREVTLRLGGADPSHFAIMGYHVAQERDAIARRMRGKYGLRTVFYRIAKNPRTNGSDHFGLRELLFRLAVRTYKMTLEEATARLQEERSTALGDEILPRSPTRDPRDPEKNQWSGRSEGDGRRLSLDSFEAVSKHHLRIVLVLESTDAGRPLVGSVQFYLHPTFGDAVKRVEVVDGVARLTFLAFGAFTVGVSADNGATKLELDLSRHAALPDWFRER